jgi:hypothetical protein
MQISLKIHVGKVDFYNKLIKSKNTSIWVSPSHLSSLILLVQLCEVIQLSNFVTIATSPNCLVVSTVSHYSLISAN